MPDSFPFTERPPVNGFLRTPDKNFPGLTAFPAQDKFLSSGHVKGPAPGSFIPVINTNTKGVKQ